MSDDPLSQIVADVLLLRPDQIGDDAGVGRTPNWDSMQTLMIMLEVERVYAIKVPFKAYGEIATVKDIRMLIARVRG